jgi:hypothetical protein
VDEPTRRIFAGGRWQQVGDQAITVPRHCLQDKVLSVERLAGEEELRYSLVDPSSYFEVEMRSSNARCVKGVRSGLDRRKPVPALTVGELDSVTLEVWIEGRRIGIGRMVVATKGVGLPEFNACALDRHAALVNNPASHENDLSLSLAAVAPDVGQVGILVRMLDNGIEGAGRGARRRRQHFLGPSPKRASRQPDSRDACQDAKPEKLSSCGSPFVRIHFDRPPFLSRGA